MPKKSTAISPPEPDSPSNSGMQDVEGNKKDAAVTVPDDISSEIAYLKGILTLVAGVTTDTIYTTVTNRTPGSAAFALANIPEDIINLDGEAGNTAYKGRAKLSMNGGVAGTTIIVHRWTKINGVLTEMLPAEEIILVINEDDTRDYDFEDTETFKLTIETSAITASADYEYAYASRGE